MSTLIGFKNLNGFLKVFLKTFNAIIFFDTNSQEESQTVSNHFFFVVY